MNTRVVMLAVAGWASACASTSTLPLNMPAAQYVEVNRELARRKVRFTYTTGELGELENARLQPDSVTGIPTLYAYGRAITPLDQVMRLEVRSRGKGALRGLGYGAALGAVAAVADMKAENMDEYAGSFTLLGSVTVGALWGAAIGAIRQDRKIFEVQPATTAQRR